MPDNISVVNGAYTRTIRTSDVGGIDSQHFKLEFGGTGVATPVEATKPLPVVTNQDGPQNLILSRFLDKNGDGTGGKMANEDYSVTSQIFLIKPPAGKIFRIRRLAVSILDTVSINTGDYGGIGGGLTNGIKVRIQNDSGTIIEFNDGIPIKTNSDLMKFGSIFEVIDLGGGQANPRVVRIIVDFQNSGQLVRLDGDANERLEIFLNDDLTGLTEQTFFAFGYEESNPT